MGGMRATGVAHIKIALRGMEGMRQGAKERSRHINGHKQLCRDTSDSELQERGASGRASMEMSTWSLFI